MGDYLLGFFCVSVAVLVITLPFWFDRLDELPSLSDIGIALVAIAILVWEDIKEVFR